MKRLLLFLAFLLWCVPAFAKDWTNGLDADVVLAVKFEEQSSTYTDSSGNGNNGTVSGSMTRSATGKRNVYALDDTAVNNANVDFGSAASLDDINPITVCAWILPHSDGNNSGALCNAGAIWSKSDGSSGKVFCQATTGELQFYTKWTSGSARWHTGDNALLYDSTWHHACFEYDGSATGNNATIWLDGVSQSLTNPGARSGSQNSDAAYSVKVLLEGSDNAGEFDGTIDDLLVVKRILNQAEIQDHMNCGLDGTACAAGPKVIGGGTIGGGTI